LLACASKGRRGIRARLRGLNVLRHRLRAREPGDFPRAASAQERRNTAETQDREFLARSERGQIHPSRRVAHNATAKANA
jgi:hypothetical protein